MATLPREKGRKPVLGISDPRVEKSLAALNLNDLNVAETRRFGNRIQAEADRWMLRGGFSESRRITKSDAHRMFVLAFGRASR
jgi:hypothetical protein